MAGKKNPREWGSIRKQPTKSARYQASYVGPDLRRHFAPVTFESKMMAERWLNKEKDRIDRCAASDEGLASWKPPEVISEETKAVALTVAQYAKTVIGERNLKARTRIGYEASLKNSIEPKLGRYAVRDLTPALVRSWFSGLGSTHPTRNAHAYALLNMVCNTAVRDGLIERNPCMIERAMNPKTKRQAVVPTIPELEAIADKLGSDTKNARFRALVLLSAWCGLRYGEVSELRRKDFDADCSVVTVARAVTHRRGDDGQWCRIDTPKDGKPAKVVIPPHIRADVKNHLVKYVGKAGDSLLFTPARGGCHVNDRVFAKDVFEPALAAIGRDDMRVHDLRHFAGTMTAQVGNLVETMARLRHTTHKASLIYQQQVSGRDIAVAEALSALRTNSLAAQQDSESLVGTDS
nr:site-specific integrase [Mycolicibacterium houstonense]